MREWIDELRELAGRTRAITPRSKKRSQRMQEENPHLSPEQARHLTMHGINQNEDGTYSWKFDNYVRASRRTHFDEIDELWSRISCPTLLVAARRAGPQNPLEDGRVAHFHDARVVSIEKRRPLGAPRPAGSVSRSPARFPLSRLMPSPFPLRTRGGARWRHAEPSQSYRGCRLSSPRTRGEGRGEGRLG